MDRTNLICVPNKFLTETYVDNMFIYLFIWKILILFIQKGCIKLIKHDSKYMISGTPVARVSSFKYLGVNISEDLTWTTHIQTQVKKARQRLYHLRQLRKFRVSPAILKTFYSGAIESVLTQCISVWYNNATNQDCKALQSRALSWAHLRVCSPLSAGHLPQTL